MIKVCHALHGFLGKPSDWDLFSAGGIGVDIFEKVDILKEAVPSAEIGMRQWAKKFNASVGGNKEQRILMGYSMGGRLAFHALLENPELWTSAVLVSAHTGLKTSAAKTERQAADEVWAKRFEEETWNSLITSWNSRDIFVSKNASFERQESCYVRRDLANILRYWSLGGQQELSGLMAQLPMPILWIVGEEDRNYCERAAQMTFSHPKSRIWIAPGAGHRVPWECSIFEQHVKDFSSKIMV